MKVVYYKRTALSPTHIHASYHEDMFYIPEREVVLFSETAGTFGDVSFDISKKPEILDEARSIADGKKPELERVEYSNIKTFDYDSKKVDVLIADAIKKQYLDHKVKKGLEGLISKTLE